MPTSGSVEGFGCRPATSARHTSVAGVRKPPRKEPAGGGARRMPRTPLWGFGWCGRCERGSAVSFEAVGYLAGRQPQLGLMIETVNECVGCKDAELSGRRICASVVGAGLQPTLGKVVSASFQHIDRDHDVSILTAMIGPVGR